MTPEEICAKCHFQHDCDVKPDHEKCPVAWACQCADKAEGAEA